MTTYYIKTYGCQMNYSDSERMEAYLKALGLRKHQNINEADLVFFNTCSIRQKAEDKVMGELFKLKKQQKKERIVALTGCMVRTSSSRYSSKRDKLFSSAHGLDIALRIEELPRLADLIREINPATQIQEIVEESLEDYFKITPTHSSHQTKAQAFVAISNGCDKFCTYCIVPYSRGREKSRSIEDIYLECAQLVENGCQEITLIGQTVNSYGLSNYDQHEGKFQEQNTKEPFVALLEKIDTLKNKGLKRVRFTSPHPKDMSNQLIDAMATLTTQMPYLHLPVQAGDNITLRRMNRTYTVEQYKEIIKKLRQKIPGIAISTDIIVGFCGETEEEFENTYNFFKEMAFEHAFISRYSERTGTTAAKFMEDNIDHQTKADRWHKLNDLLKQTSQAALKRFLGQTLHVLIENQEGEICHGRSEHYKNVEVKSGRKILGKIVPVKITAIQPWLLEGELV